MRRPVLIAWIRCSHMQLVPNSHGLACIFLVRHGFTQKCFRWQFKAVNSMVTRVTGNTDTLEVLKSDKRDNPCQG